MKKYVGSYMANEWSVLVEDGKDTRALDPCLDVRNHSPTGFAWGYGGSGPAQLAIALMCDVFGKPKSEEELLSLHPVHYQEFKYDFIARLEMRQSWSITEEGIRSIVERLRRRTV